MPDVWEAALDQRAEVCESDRAVQRFWPLRDDRGTYTDVAEGSVVELPGLLYCGGSLKIAIATNFPLYSSGIRISAAIA